MKLSHKLLLIIGIATLLSFRRLQFPTPTPEESNLADRPAIASTRIPCRTDDYFANHTAEFTNIDLSAKMLSPPEASLMQAVVASLPQSHNNNETLLIDIGGNMGDMTALMRRTWGRPARIDVFDIIGSFVKRLERRFAADSNIEIHHYAMSNENGRVVEILGSPAWKSRNALHTGASVLKRGDEYNTVLERVDTLTLDSFLGPWPVTFMKIDTEGNDYHVLLGANRTLRARHVSVVFFENNQMQQNINATLFKTVRFLETTGYHTYYFSRARLILLNELCPNNTVFLSQETGNAVALPAKTELEQSVVTIYAELRAGTDVQPTLQP